MSTFLGFESYLIPLGSTVMDVQNTFKNAMNSYGWQVQRQAITPAAVLTTGMTNAAYALNNVQSQAAGDGTALPRWVGVQMTYAFTPTVMYLQGYQDAHNTAPLNFTLDWSDNGSTWTTHQTWTGENKWGVMERRKYTITAAPAKNYWRINVTAVQTGTTMYISTWILEDAAKNWITSNNFFDVIPPVTETIGNAIAREYIRFIISTNTIIIRPMQELLIDLPPMFSFDTPVSGAVTLSITINGTTVSYTGISTNSSLVNARKLYEACKASMDANFLAYQFYWEPITAYTIGGGIIKAVKKTTSRHDTISSSNIVTRLRGVYVQAQPQFSGDSAAYYYSVSTDLVNGFIYYLQVNARGIALSTKITTGYSTPIHCCYGDNASAIAQTPQSTTKEIPCTPSEIIVGTDQATTSTGASGRFTHLWGVSSGLGSWMNGVNGGQNDNLNNVGYPYSSNMWNMSYYMGQLQDLSSGTPNTNYGAQGLAWLTHNLFGGGLFIDGDSGTFFPIHRQSVKQSVNWQYTRYSDTYSRMVSPSYDNLDWYKYYGTLTDEQLVFAPSTDFMTTISSSVNLTDTVINVADTTGFPSAGYLVIEWEVVEYTSKTGTSFTGCVRGKYASTVCAYEAGDVVSIGCWLVKIQNGCLFAGYTKPV
ncbi:MAG: hypothetical protein JHC33_00615 [Ignisphaera sp.]|nr:hypothetical protein [Ignisphaera sp.]